MFECVLCVFAICLFIFCVYLWAYKAFHFEKYEINIIDFVLFRFSRAEAAIVAHTHTYPHIYLYNCMYDSIIFFYILVTFYLYMYVLIASCALRICGMLKNAGLFGAQKQVAWN